MAKNPHKIYSLMKNETGITDIVAAYRDWVKDGDYDQDITAAEHNGSIFMAEEMKTLIPKENRAGVRVLDVGAGTGRGAIELRQHGFVNIDALDPSPEMLEVAKTNNLYQKYICAFVDENQLEIKAGTYDAVITVGSISMDHLPAIAIQEILRILNKGGIFVMVGSAREWYRIAEYSVKMTNLITQLEKAGRLRLLKKTTRENYMFQQTPEAIDAIIYVIEKT